MMVLVKANTVPLLVFGLFLGACECSLNITGDSGNVFERPSSRNGFGPGQQDWGFVTVREGAHKFWWLFLHSAENASESTPADTTTQRPLAIWLQGGPGASSTGFGNFEEIGPLDIDQTPRNFTWVKDMHVLFLDSPVGSGFSYVDDVRYLAKDNAQIAEDLVQLMRGFYAVHPELESAPVHIFGESYGGKVAVEFAYILQKAIAAETIKSNLISVNSIDGWISPIDSVLSWAPFLLHMGFVDDEGHEQIMQSANATRDLLDGGKYEEATQQWFNTESVIFNVTGAIDFYNVMNRLPMDGDETQVRDFDDRKLSELMNGPVKKALNISADVEWAGQSSKTFQWLSGDFMKPNTRTVEMLLNETSVDVSIITGQLDLIVATPGTLNWVNRIRWNDYDAFVASPRQFVAYNGILEGYVKHHKHFRMYWVNRAGHMVPLDNPNGMDAILREVTKYNES